MKNRAKDNPNFNNLKNDTASQNQVKNTTDNALSKTGKPLSIWQSPEFEEFDLCMEVTAYVQQWD